jgi:hypothetical protein
MLRILAHWVRQWYAALLLDFDKLLTCTGLMGGLVNGPAFDTTFKIDPKSKSGANLIALIVAIVSTLIPSYLVMLISCSMKLAAFLAP